MKRAHKFILMLAPVVAVAVALSTLFWMPGTSGVAALPGMSWPPQDARALPVKAGEGKMIELEVRDVIPIVEANTHAVVLVSKDQQYMLPIFVTEEAAVSIAFRLAERASPHPLAADLLDDVVHGMGGKVREVRIDDVQDDIYLSQVVIRQGDKDVVLAARPSDAIAMALTDGATIVCSPKVMAHAGITQEEINALRDELGVGGGGMDPGMPHGEDDPGLLLPSSPDSDNIRL